MSVSLVKVTQGNKVDLTKTNPGITRFRAGLGWRPNTSSSSSQFDLDVTAFVLDANDKVLSEDYMVFYNNLKDPAGFLVHSGDNRDGVGDGDDESIVIDIARAPLNAVRIAIVVTIDDAVSRSQNFGMVRDSYIKIYNDTTGEALLEYELGENASGEIAMRFADIYLKDGQWKFDAVGTGQSGGLATYVREFGLEPA